MPPNGPAIEAHRRSNGWTYLGIAQKCPLRVFHAQWRRSTSIDSSCRMNAVDGVFAHQRALEGHWRAIADRGMAASDIIKSLDEFKHGEFDFRLRLKRAPIEQFAFECGEKRLGHRVVVRIAHRTDGWHHTHFPAPLAEGEARVLAAVIGMMDHPTVGPTLREGHVDGRQPELGPQMILHR